MLSGRRNAVATGHGSLLISGLGSRRHRFWFGMVSLAALSLPYAGGLAGALQAELNAGGLPISIPAVAVPVAQFPRLAVPHLAAVPVTRPPATPARTSASSTRTV